MKLTKVPWNFEILKIFKIAAIEVAKGPNEAEPSQGKLPNVRNKKILLSSANQ